MPHFQKGVLYRIDGDMVKLLITLTSSNFNASQPLAPVSRPTSESKTGSIEHSMRLMSGNAEYFVLIKDQLNPDRII